MSEWVRHPRVVDIPEERDEIDHKVSFQRTIFIDQVIVDRRIMARDFISNTTGDESSEW